jgi:hypothetical protein
MWGNAYAAVDNTGEEVPCVFTAKARRSKYDPVRIRIFLGEEGDPDPEAVPRLKTSALTPKARRYLRALERTKENCAKERQAAQEVVRRMWR